MQVFTILIALNFLIPSGTVNADGMVIPSEKYIIRESGQKAVIFYEEGTETLVLSITFRGDAKDFGWVIPVPQKPEVSKGSDEIFTSLEEITKKNDYYEIVPLMNAIESGRQQDSVTIIETKKIDYYDIAVLSATESQALAKWLSDNGYQYPKESAYILNDYINNNWYFVAVKISPEAAGATQVTSGLEEGHATPLKLVFKSDAIIYPLRISSIEANKNQIMLSDNLLLDSERIAELKNIGYGELTDNETGPAIIREIIQDLAEEKQFEDSVAAEYPLIISDYNFNAAYCSSFSTCRSFVESWFNSYFSREGLYYDSYYSRKYVPIHLYIIADGKKEIPGFSVDYANWIKAGDIKDLAYDVNGNSLIDPAGAKYYLTSLWCSMAPSDMTSDLVARPADDNSRVNAPDPAKNILWGLLAGLGCIFAWIVSPFGMIFIISTVVRVFVKSDIFRIFAKVFQIISVFLTIGLLLSCVIMAVKFSQQEGANIWTIALSAALGLILLFQLFAVIRWSKNLSQQ